MKLAIVVAVLACFAVFSEGQVLQEQFAELNIDDAVFCNIPCVQDVFANNCGGIACSLDLNDEASREAACDGPCEVALIGEIMVTCLSANLPEGMDVDGIAQLIGIGYENFCGTVEPDQPIGSIVAETSNESFNDVDEGETGDNALAPDSSSASAPETLFS